MRRARKHSAGMVRQGEHGATASALSAAGRGAGRHLREGQLPRPQPVLPDHPLPGAARPPGHPGLPERGPMATVLSVSGSPSVSSRTAPLVRHLDDASGRPGPRGRPARHPHDPGRGPARADFRHPAIVEATELFARADGVVIGTPVYKAAYSGLLKALLDLLPQYALPARPCCRWPRRHHRPRPGHRLRAAAGAQLHGRRGTSSRAGSPSTRTSASGRTARSRSPRPRPRPSTQVVDQFLTALGPTPVLAAAS